jgi:hypothetical protein
MEPVGSEPAEMWDYLESGRWIYTKTMRVASFIWQTWKRGVLCLLLLASLPILLPVLLMAFGVGFTFLVPFLPAIAAYFFLFRRFSALRISGCYRYLKSYTSGLRSAESGVLEVARELPWTSNIASQAIEKKTGCDTWSGPQGGGVLFDTGSDEGNAFLSVPEPSTEPTLRLGCFEGSSTIVQEVQEQFFSPQQHERLELHEESTTADQCKVHFKESSPEGEKVPSLQGSHVAGDMEMLSDDEYEESNPIWKPTLQPQWQLSFSEVGGVVGATNSRVPFSEQHNKNRQSDNEQVFVNTLESVNTSIVYEDEYRQSGELQETSDLASQAIEENTLSDAWSVLNDTGPGKDKVFLEVPPALRPGCVQGFFDVMQEGQEGSFYIEQQGRLKEATREEILLSSDQREVHVKENNLEAERMPSLKGWNEADDMEVLSDDGNEESNPVWKPTLFPQRRLTFSEAGDEMEVADSGVSYSEEHIKDRQPDHEELCINTSEYGWPSEAEEHGFNSTPRGETDDEESITDNSRRTTRWEEQTPAQAGGLFDPASEYMALLPDTLDHTEDWQTCRQRWEDGSRPGGLSPTTPSLEPPSSEARTMCNPLFEFFTPSPAQQKSRAGGKKLLPSKHSRSMNRHSTPGLLQTQTWAAGSATSPPHDTFREFKKAKYSNWSDVKEPTARLYSASQSQSADPYVGEFETLLHYWRERDIAAKSPAVSLTRTPTTMPPAEVARQIREEISTIKRIIGQDIPAHYSLWKDVETLSQILGIQLPYMGDISDLTKAKQGLDLLKVIVGIRGINM